MTSSEILQQIIGPDLMDRVCESLGGASMYIPTQRHDDERDDRIKSKFVQSLQSGATCMSAYELAANDVHLSVSRVRQIVAENR